MFDKENKEVSLKDCCEIHARIGWQALTQKEHMKSGEYVLVTGTDFVNNAINFDSCVYVKKERYEMDPHIILKENDILVTKDGTIGKVAIVKNLPKPATLNSGIFVIRPDRRFDKDYIAYVFKGPIFEHFVDSVKTGATIKHLNQNKLVEFKIPVPTLKKQEEFSLFCHHLDKSKFLLQKILEKLELLKKSRFIEMFGDPIKNEKRWPQLTLDSVCDGIGDGLHGTPEYDDLGAFYFINGNNLINGTIVITPSTKKVNETTYKKYFTNISSNALLLSINGTLGKIAFYNDEAITLGKSACYINLKSFVNRYFVFELMRTDPFLKYLEENSTKSTIKNVSLKTIRNFKLISPPEILQNDFIAFSKQIDKSKLVIQKSLEDLVGKS